MRPEPATNVKRWAPSHRRTRLSIRTTLVTTFESQRAVIFRVRLLQPNHTLRAVGPTKGRDRRSRERSERSA